MLLSGERLPQEISSLIFFINARTVPLSMTTRPPPYLIKLHINFNNISAKFYSPYLVKCQSELIFRFVRRNGIKVYKFEAMSLSPLCEKRQ